MGLTSEQRKQVEQIRKFAADLNLSDDQKEKLRAFLDWAKEREKSFRKVGPNLPTTDLVRAVAFNPDEIRQQIVNFLTPEQLTKWDNAAKKQGVVGKSAA